MSKKKDKKKKISPQNRSALEDLVKELLTKCSVNINGNTAENLKNYHEFQVLLEQIKILEKDIGRRPEYDREKMWTEFMDWCKLQNIISTDLKLIYNPEQGFGLKTERDIKENELMMTIPRKCMLTVEDVTDAKLRRFIDKDRILQQLPNVALSLILLNEISNSSSFWMPYLKILPNSYNTVLYFNAEQLTLLKGSPNFDGALKMNRNIARQYAYFHRILHNDPEYRNSSLKDIFTYDNYRWAVSTVMSRQNALPNAQRTGHTIGFIPLWDMCNHLPVQMSTDYDDQNDACTCFAMMDFPQGSQVSICYGKRTNSQLFLNSGFVCDPNPFDNVSIKLGISKSDSLYQQKCILLQQLSIPVCDDFGLAAKSGVQADKTLLFLKIFSATKDDISKYEQDAKLLALISDKDKENAMKFLSTRASLLLRTYPTSLEDDRNKLEDIKKSNSGDNAIQQLILQLLISEKTILTSHK